MSRSDVSAARVRGGFVGVLSAAAALAGHGLAGASVPAGSALLLLTLGAGLVGALAGLPARMRIAPLTGLLLVGQALGHLVLTVAGHQHGAGGSPAAMLIAHTVAAVGCAALIVLAEHGWRRVASAGQWVVLLTGGFGPAAEPRIGAGGRWSHRPMTPRFSAHCALSRRGPPAFAHC